MSIADKWNEVDLVAFAADWMREMRSGRPPADDDIGSAVVLMNFTAPAEVQWSFLLAAVDAAESDDELDAIAAGPFEHLLGSHGEDYIANVESHCRKDAKFARMTRGAWQYRMSDEVWTRVQALRAAVHDPL